MKLLVTGGAGFVGSHFLDRFVEEHEITVVDDFSNGSLSNIRAVRRTIRLVRADVSKESILRKIGRVEGIFHLACHPRSFSFKNPTRDVDVNVRSTLLMLELARKFDAKLIFSSNTGIYGDPQYLPMDEQHPINCKTPYDVDKYASELQIKTYGTQYGLRAVVCRFATVFGPRQRVNEKLGWRPLVATFVRYMMMKKRPTVFGDGEQTRDLIYVKDIVEGLMRAFSSKQAEGGVFNLSTEVETSVNMVLRKLCTLLGEEVEPERGPPSVGDLRRMCCSNAKARETFNFEIKYPLDAALREYVESYKKQY
jgi:UDP-glucose 4-epimerase